ncbi:protein CHLORORESPIRATORY REDUCTION 42, chloroplastic [Elaeis guineensis]|uniref:Uncharacterized protein LOC105057661 n=1 Tax=Elaeis guineensis var. tenera TaxID=51953 RepID=A0A6I9S7U8_ELAGV|nr:uncharacterized protein LOC105057661 [Elaeis guineensis]
MSASYSIPSWTLPSPIPPLQQPKQLNYQFRRFVPVVHCISDSKETSIGNGNTDLRIGSPIIVVEAPPMLKTASSIPTLRANSGLVKPGDVGRIVARKPKDVWAVRLAIGTYLLDGKHFKPLDIEE